MRTMMQSESIRNLMCACVLASSAALGGCGSSDDEGTKELTGELEVFSWWTSPGEAEALAALVKTFNAKHPKVAVVNSAVAGGGGTAARQTLSDRLKRGNPPDSFQVHGGAELIDSWVRVDGDDNRNMMESLDFLYDQQGWRNVMPPDLLDIVSHNGQIYSVLVNIHRANTVFYNAKVLADNNLTAPTTWDEFYAMGDALKAKNIAPLALGAKDVWSVSMMFENILLSKGGPDYYRAFFAGEKSADDPQVLDTAKELVKVLDYVQADAERYTWDGASELVQQGKAAMTLMGDWAKGYLTGKHMIAGQDFGVFPAPGTSGSFIVVSDTFGMPKGAPHRDNAVALLSTVGSKEAQDAFNPLKGSIPARSDADTSKYDSLAQATIADFNSNELVASMAHGSAASPAFVASFNTTMSTFLENRDAAGLVADLKTYYARLQR